MEPKTNRVWMERFAALQKDEAVESVAASIAPIILENFDGAPYGSVKWATLPASDKDILRVIARRAMMALTAFAHVHVPNPPRPSTGRAGWVKQADRCCQIGPA